MKIVLVLAVAVLLALAAIWWLPLLKGYVLIRAGGWVVEMNLLVMLLGLLSIYALLRLVHWLWNLPGNTLRGFLARRAQAQLELGLLALSEGDFGRAEKALVHSAKHRDTATLGYLGAAQAASAHGHGERSESYLEKAESAGHAHVSVALARAERLLGEGDPESALAELASVHRPPDTRPKVLELLVRCHESLQNWPALAALAPELLRARVIDKHQAHDIRLKVALVELVAAKDMAKLHGAWRKLPRGMRKDSRVLVEYARIALQFGNGDAVESVVRDALDRHWSDDLALLYSRLPGGDASQRARQAEAWLQARPDNAVVHLLIARRCAVSKLWAKALEHYQTSIVLGAGPQAWRELAEIQLEMAQPEAAMESMRRAFDLATAKASQASPASITLNRGLRLI